MRPVYTPSPRKGTGKGASVALYMDMSASSAPALAVESGTKGGWLVVFAAFFGVMVSFGSMLVFTFSVFLKPLSSEFGWSERDGALSRRLSR